MPKELPHASGGGGRPSHKKLFWIGGALLILVALFTPLNAQALSNDLKHLLNAIGRDIKANQSGKFCEPQLFAEVGVSLEHVSRDLLDFRLTEDSSEKHERHEGAIEPHTGAAGGVQATRCTGKFNALWLIKPGTQADAGSIRISADVTDCPCKSATDLKRGHLQFVVPVIRARNFDGTYSYSAGSPRDFIVEAECCSGRKQSRTGGFEASATATRVDSPPPKPQAAPQPQPAPTPAPRPPAKPPEPVKPPPDTPQWSVDNPCPPCQSWKDYLDRTLAEIARLEAENRALNEELGKLDAEAKRKQQEIERLRNVIKLQEGTGGSATNYPQPGWSTESVTQADGRVRITVRDASGKVVEESFREREDLGRLRKKIDDLEESMRQDRQKQDRQKQERLKQDMERNQRGIEAKKGQADAYRKGLEDCIREKCSGTTLQTGQIGQAMPSAPLVATDTAKPAEMTTQAPTQALGPTPTGTVIKPEPTQATEPPKPTGCRIHPTQPFDVGPRDKVGTGATRTIEKAAGGFLGGLLGKATGGMLGGGGSGDDAASGPDLVSDPIKNEDKQTFEFGDDVKIRVGSQWTPEGLLISTEIIKAPGKGTFQVAAMQDDDCEWEPPDKYLYFKLWAEWSLSVNWTRDHYVNDQHVKHEEGGWQEFGTQDIARGKVNVTKDGQIVIDPPRIDDAPGKKRDDIYAKVAKGKSQVQIDARLIEMTPVWRRAGFGAATGGIQSMGTLFKVTPAQIDHQVRQVTYPLTNPSMNPVRTIPLDFVVIGSGLLKEAGEPSKIPVLRDIPLVGKLFTRKGDEASAKRPLIMMIRPTVMVGGE